MKLKLQLIIESDSGETEVVREVTKLERRSLRPENLGCYSWPGSGYVPARLLNLNSPTSTGTTGASLSAARHAVKRHYSYPRRSATLFCSI